MQRITNKITGEVYEAEQLFDPMLNDSNVKAEFRMKDGSVIKLKAKHPANLFLGKIQLGTPIVLLFKNLKTARGLFGGIDKSDNAYGVILTDWRENAAIAFNSQCIVGYFLK